MTSESYYFIPLEDQARYSVKSMDRPHSPAQLWSYRVPSPPRLIVPPPNLSITGTPELQILQNAAHNFESSGFANTEFLKTVTYNNFIKTNTMLEWQYEDRRNAQQVLPFLYLGPSSAARDTQFLLREGITMVIAVRNILIAQARMLWSKPAEALNLEMKAIDVAGNQELIAQFSRGIEMINEHLSRVYRNTGPTTANGSDGVGRKTGKILIFCETGNERSAALIVAYIMAMYSHDVVTAIQIVQAQRFAVAFDDSLRNTLLTYEGILKAQRDSVQATMSQASHKQKAVALGPANGKIKRSYEDYDDEDMDMEMDGDGQVETNGVLSREGYEPFHQ
ncbi:uncharacterized protein KY384_007369 [Bacidia gigantensis]|uniref:uncharacterized protein n=1 Tax=Bacidia gigantensis TaxID=2732470 RepID=UPI001D036522|nr:uncharacterized protein KY384_007369 [Bacidia gigantensis]KAG8528451.1 hypothetical protein KY384_007369 [Bacidia gigantensis]